MKLACIGGGTGLSTILRGLKKHSDNITAIVTVSDNGGSSGILRREMNMLPPGDIRNCLLALAETEPVFEDLFQYRFKEGSLRGQNLGNLFLAALTDMYQNFGHAVEKANDILRVRGRVLPVTLEDIELEAHFVDGTTLVGETQIVEACKEERKEIKKISLLPANPKVHSHVIDAIEEADIVLLGPGSLFTSIVPNLLVDGVAEALKRTKAKVVYVGNIMTQPGETEGFSLSDHLGVIESYLEPNTIDMVVCNSAHVNGDILKNYLQDGAAFVRNDCESYLVIEAPMALVEDKEKHIRHDADVLAEIINQYCSAGGGQVSFSSTIKEELARHAGDARHCLIAELTAIINICGRVDQKIPKREISPSKSIRKMGLWLENTLHCSKKHLI